MGIAIFSSFRHSGIPILAGILLPALGSFVNHRCRHFILCCAWIRSCREYPAFLCATTTLSATPVRDIRSARITKLPPQALLAGLYFCRRLHFAADHCLVEDEVNSDRADSFCLLTGTFLRFRHAFIRHCFAGQLDGNRKRRQPGQKGTGQPLRFQGQQGRDCPGEKRNQTFRRGRVSKSARSTKWSSANSPSAASA